MYTRQVSMEPRPNSRDAKSDIVIPDFYFRWRRLFRRLLAAVAPVDFSRECRAETDSEKADRLAVERGENEGMAFRGG